VNEKGLCFDCGEVTRCKCPECKRYSCVLHTNWNCILCRVWTCQACFQPRSLGAIYCKTCLAENVLVNSK
jgi:hypothetical protein